MADLVIKLLGKRYPTLTMSLIGYIVSVPVFCDSAFVILNSLKESMAKRMGISSVAMSVALVTSSALVAPLLPELGLASEMGRVLTVMAIGAGAMIVSHANDSFFWVVSQFSRMSVSLAYRAHTMATLVQGITAMIFIYILSLVLI